MSLIPSESASFPDLLGRGLGASKKSKWREPQALGQPPPPPPPKAEPAAEPAPPASPVEEKLEPVASEITPLAPDSVGNVQPPPDKAPPPLPEKTSGPVDSELTPIAPPPPVKIEPVPEIAIDAGAVKPGNSDLGQSAALLAGSAKIEPSSGTTAPPVEGDERFKPPGPELTPSRPMAQVEKQTPPSDAALEKIPDPLPTTSEKALPELSAAAPAEETKIAETPERIPIRPIARSNSTAAGQTEAAAAAEPAKAESKAPVRSVVPQPRPHPNLQPRFESDLNTADTGQPESLTTPIFSGAENPESVTYPEYLAPEIAMRDEDLELAEPAAESPDAQRQARIKFFGFVSCEIVVLALLVVSVLLGWSHRLGSGSLAKAGAIVAAIAAVALPIVFYGFPKTLSRDRHLNRSLGERYRLKRD